MGKLLALGLVLLALKTVSSTRLDDRSLLSQTVESMGKLAKYYEDNYGRMNLDGIFGARLAAAQLKGVLGYLKELKAIDTRFRKIVNKVKILQVRFQNIADNGLDSITIEQPAYFESMGFILIDGHWEKIYPLRTVDPALITPVSGEGINETISDLCISELIKKKCAITEYCWNKMTSSGYRFYSITHEILYLMIADDYGCQIEVELLANNKYNKSVDQLQSSFCSNVFAESERIADRKFPMKYRDIFLEQIAVCGSLGFKDFFPTEWLENILSWQNDSGCFSFRRDASKARKKRENWVLEDGCASHATAVAVAALTQYIKYFLQSEIYDAEER